MNISISSESKITKVVNSSVLNTTVDITINGKYGFHIWFAGVVPFQDRNSISVLRTVNGKANGIQRMGKVIWSWEELEKAYKKLAPAIPELRKHIELV